MKMSESRKSGLYAEFLKFYTNGDYEKAIKTSNRLLHEFPDEEKAFELKIITSIHLSRFQESIEFMNKSPKLSTNLGFERAYCLYRLERTNEALALLDEEKSKNKGKENGRNVELRVQILYRLEEFELCAKLYGEIVREREGDEWGDERRSNLAAIHASLAYTHPHILPSLSPLDDEEGVDDELSFEELFNRASLASALGSWDSALTLLRRSEGRCVEVLSEEGVSEEEIEAELSLIRAQLAYVLAKSGRIEEGKRENAKLLKLKPTDPGVGVVVSNNMLVWSGGGREGSVFESKKRVRGMNVEGMGYKIMSPIKNTIRTNIGIYYFHMGQYDECSEVVKSLDENSVERREIQVGVCYKTQGISHTLSLIQKYNIPKEEKLKLFLGLSQLALLQGKVDDGIEVLSQVWSSCKNLGVLSGLLTLYLHKGEIEKGKNILNSALSSLSKSGDERGRGVVWRKLNYLVMKDGKKSGGGDEEAIEAYLKEFPKDTQAQALRILSYLNKGDLKRSVEFSKGLPTPSLPDPSVYESPSFLSSLRSRPKAPPSHTPPSVGTSTLIGGGDGRSKSRTKPLSSSGQLTSENRGRGGAKSGQLSPLEKRSGGGGVRSGQLGSGSSGGGMRSEEEGGGGVRSRVRRKKRVKKEELKNYEEGREPDPQRWIAKRDRVGARGRGRGAKRGDVGKGTQGSATEGGDAYDMSKMTPSGSSKPQQKPTPTLPSKVMKKRRK